LHPASEYFFCLWHFHVQYTSTGITIQELSTGDCPRLHPASEYFFCLWHFHVQYTSTGITIQELSTGDCTHSQDASEGVTLLIIAKSGDVISYTDQNGNISYNGVINGYLK